MSKAGWVHVVGVVAAALLALVVFGSESEAQGVLSFSGQAKSALPQSRIAEDAASPSRRCHFTFAAVRTLQRREEQCAAAQTLRVSE